MYQGIVPVKPNIADAENCGDYDIVCPIVNSVRDPMDDHILDVLEEIFCLQIRSRNGIGPF